MIIYQFHFFDLDNLVHGVTSKNAEDTSTYGSFNLATHVGDNPQKVSDKRQQLANKIDAKVTQLVFASQTHSTNVRVVTSVSEILEDTDAMITNQKDVCLNVLTADCVPILLVDPIDSVIAVVHAGWKGTAGEITKATVLKMKEVFGVAPQNVLVGIGPCISFDNYEVGKEVVTQFSPAFYSQKSNGNYSLDLVKANMHQLTSLGVKKANIEIMNICTKVSPRFYSARREGIQSGRFSSFLMLK